MKIFSSFFLVFLLAACQRIPELTEAEKPLITTLTSHMQTRCLGRYLIDIPQGMSLGMSENMGAKVDGVNLEVQEISKGIFSLRLEKRTATLKQRHLVNEPEKKVLKEIIQLPDQSGLVFNRTEGDESPNQQVGRVFELHGWKNGYSIKMTVEATDMSFVPPQEVFRWNGIQSDTKEKLALLLDMYSRVSGRNDLDIPSEPGLCIPNGFMRGKAGDSEEAWLVQILKSTPDVHLHFLSDSRIQTDESLLDRESRIVENGKELSSHYRRLRSGSRKSNTGFAFDELLSAEPTDEYLEGGKSEKILGHYFQLEANSKIGKAATPLLMIALNNGQRERDPRGLTETYDKPWPRLSKASLSEAQAIALWDAITSTLRPRPNGF